MMIKYIFILILFLTLNFTAKANFTLTIVIEKLKNSDGSVLLEFCDENGNKIKGLSKKVQNKKCIFKISNLKKGKYTFKYFHDENSNKELDTNWIGMPVEGIGYSNNAKGSFGPPDVEDTVFEITKDTTLKCVPIYL